MGSYIPVKIPAKNFPIIMLLDTRWKHVVIHSQVDGHRTLKWFFRPLVGSLMKKKGEGEKGPIKTKTNPVDIISISHRCKHNPKKSINFHMNCRKALCTRLLLPQCNVPITLHKPSKSLGVK
ncbi:hypothetical protein YC2023_009598 [Brassica napus]